ncbi:MAG TPA: hypothetical protein VGO90_03945 [Chthoniobacteraceae bacterium]|jgi:hypothetical protein|nr:hypothetical protein [Chthoniobacter sp.]HEV7866806.1 hypothetical protein [Chthoniobacteraceae bacterium]
MKHTTLPKTLAAAFCAITLSLTTAGFAQTSVTTSSSTTSLGTISEFSPDTIVIRSETSPEPVRYSYTKTTTYVDEAGNPVSMDLVKSGLPVTVHYAKEGDRMVASRVIVRKSTTSSSGGATVEKRTSTTTAAPAAPVLEQKKSTTTTTTTAKEKD